MISETRNSLYKIQSRDQNLNSSTVCFKNEGAASKIFKLKSHTKSVVRGPYEVSQRKQKNIVQFQIESDLFFSYEVVQCETDHRNRIR